jgi:hypothetical protein
LKKPTAHQRKLLALEKESDRNVRELIRRWQALPAAKRTMFLRKRVGPGRTAL